MLIWGAHGTFSKISQFSFTLFHNFMTTTIAFISCSPVGFNVSSRVQSYHTINFKMIWNSLVFSTFQQDLPPLPAFLSLLFVSLGCPYSLGFLFYCCVCVCLRQAFSVTPGFSCQGLNKFWVSFSHAPHISASSSQWLDLSVLWCVY